MAELTKEFVQEALRALHITEFTHRIPYLNIWLLGLAAVFGFLACFFGYRHRNLLFAGICLVFGGIVGTWVYHQGWLDVNFSVALALVAATVFVFTYQLSPAELAFGIAMYWLLLRWQFPIESSLAVSILLAIAALFLGRWILSILTAVSGAWVLIAAFKALAPEITQLLPAAQPAFMFLNDCFYVVLVVLSLLGFLCQAGLHGNNPLFRVHKKQ